MSFAKGDTITIDRAHVDITVGKAYVITEVYTSSVEVIDDEGDEHVIENTYCTIVVKAAPPRATVIPRTFNAQYGSQPVIPVPEDEQPEEDEDTYEESKANERVTSTGLFDKGDVLVYLDGTPTLTSLTVMWCTATAVVFEETYSMPFNPAEFRRECQ